MVRFERPHGWHSIVRNDRSRSTEVDDFGWCQLKGLMRLPIGDFSPISHRFRDTATGDLLVENRQISLPHFCSTPNLTVFALLDR